MKISVFIFLFLVKLSIQKPIEQIYLKKETINVIQVVPNKPDWMIVV